MNGNWLKHEIPSEFTDEDKWLKYFSKKSILALCITGAVAFLFYQVGKFLGAGLVGIAFGALIMAAGVAPTMIPRSETEYLKGGGITYDVIAIRWLIRKSKKIIYIKGYRVGRKRDK